MSKWIETTLGDICTGIFDGPHATPKKTTSGPIFLGISNLSNGRIELASPEFLSEEDYTKWTRRVTPEQGDLVFSYETRLGEAALIPSNFRCCLGRRMGLLRANRSKIDQKFLLYAYLGPEFQNTLKERTIHGSTVDRLPINSIDKFPITIPPLPIQRQIAAILSAFDDKIELNRQMNRTLEQMARALFQSWFVNFDPVRAKMRGEQPEGMDVATAALFPDELVEVDGREMPKGWSYQRAESFAQITIGKTPPRQEAEWFSKDLDDVTWVSIRDMSAQDIYISRSAETLTHEAVDRFNVKTVGAGSVLLSFKLTIGRVRIAARNLATNEAIARFSFGSSSYKTNYTYFNLSSYDYSALGSTSSIATAVNSKIIKDMPFLIPTEAAIRAFDETISSIMAQLENLQNESAHLAQLRDSLLPRLLSGEVDVSEWTEVDALQEVMA